jgi:choline dehydrogenase-like flavoprotein
VLDTAQPRPYSYLVYATLVGGTSVHFAANYWRFREIDFLERTRTGGLAGTALEDWPITYAELEPYYTRAEWEVGVSGQAGGERQGGAAQQAVPHAAAALTGPGALLEIGAAKLGWLAQPAPMAILSRPYRGRHACEACGFCWGFGCEWGAKSSTVFSMIPDAVATKQCEVRPRSYVRAVETDDAGRATGVVYFDERKREARQRAKAVVLCANGAETPRLLLMSASSRFPSGLANSSGMVGKHLMFNGGSLAGGRFGHAVNGYRGAPVSRIVVEHYELDPALNLVGGGGMDFRHLSGPLVWTLFGIPPSAPKWGAGTQALAAREVRVLVRGAHPHHVAAAGGERDRPRPDGEGRLGAAGDPRHVPGAANDVRLMQYMQARSIEALQAAGALETWTCR